jgi:hypothetical protein
LKSEKLIRMIAAITKQGRVEAKSEALRVASRVTQAPDFPL